MPEEELRRHAQDVDDALAMYEKRQELTTKQMDNLLQDCLDEWHQTKEGKEEKELREFGSARALKVVNAGS
jgi:hypothetical protein